MQPVAPLPLLFLKCRMPCLGMPLPPTDLHISADPEHVCFVARINFYEHNLSGKWCSVYVLNWNLGWMLKKCDFDLKTEFH